MVTIPGKQITNPRYIPEKNQQTSSIHRSCGFKISEATIHSFYPKLAVIKLKDVKSDCSLEAWQVKLVQTTQQQQQQQQQQQKKT